MGPKTTVGVGVALSGLAFAVQEYSLRRYNLSLEIPERLWVQLGVGWMFILTGLVARQRRPDSGLGNWMRAFGLVWVGSLIFTAPLVQWHAIGWAVALYGLLFVIVYTYPTGVLRGWERWAVAGWLVFVVTIATWTLTLVDFYGWVDDTVCCPAHLLFRGPNPDLEARLLESGLILATVVFTAVVIMQVYRWRRSTRIGRRSFNALAIAVVPLLALLVAAPISNALGQGTSGFLPDVSGGGFTPSPLPDRWNLYLQNGVLMLLPVVFLVGLLKTRLSHARVGDMVQALGTAVSAGELEARLRDVLHDPGASLAFTRSRSDDYVDVAGRPLIAPAVAVVTPVDGQVSIIHDPSVDPELVTSAGSAAGLAIANARLEAELRAQLLEVQESRRRLVTATDEARRIVERDLHDGAQQRLVVLSATLRRARGRGASEDPELEALLATAAREADVAIAELRELARGVHPAILTQAGLGPAVSSLADRAPIPVEVDIGAERHPPEVEAAAYYVIAEALANVFKHSGATQARVAARAEIDSLLIEIEDDGTGAIDPEGSGLRGLEDRVGALGGSLDAGSHPSGGSTVRARIPVGGRM
jgi:signal transduction histidine kinase